LRHSQVLAAVSLATIVCAGSVGVNAGPAATPQRGLAEAAAFDQVIAANRVAEFGRRQHDPQALMVAARMLEEVPFQDKAGDGAADTAAFSPAGLLAEAKVLAKGNPQLLTQISLAQSSGGRGVLSSAFGQGLVRSVQNVAARSAYAFAIRASGGDLLRIGAIGDVTTKMVMTLFDQRGKVVCIDDNSDYAPVCSVRPQSAGSFKVEIANRSNTSVRAVILSN
jgi:hypothetical protein